MTRAVSRFLLTACCLVACAEAARACGCEPLAAKESKKVSEAVFTATVVESHKEMSPDGEEWRVKLKVEDHWKGDPREEEIVYTSGDCMVRFAPGQRLLVFAARQAGRGRLITDVCRGTAPVELTSEALAKLGKPKKRPSREGN
ncbi:MAG TPA: hypothetical protein VER32_09365 [Pyrinomonadaceae bacterium]|nr:hypothetical protein [Pyrinomonadaceae bacterium]